MKAMKKLMALALTLAMIMAMVITASAATPQSTVTIDKAQPGTTYTFYKIFSWDETKNWYKIAADSPWKSIVETYFDIDSDGYILGKKASAPVDTVIAANLLSSIPTGAEKVEVVVPSDNTATVTTSLDYGYYLMSSTFGNSDPKLASLAEIDNFTFIIREKNTESGLPEIEKVMDGGETYKVGDIRNFTVTLTMDEGDTSYVITDTMTGLTLADGSDEGTGVTVDDIYITEIPNAEVKKEITATGFKVTITFNSGYASKANDVVVITYSAKVTEDGVNGIGNTAEIEGEGESDTTTKESYEFTLNKTDGSETLEGAQFKLYKDYDSSTKTFSNEIKLVKVGDYYRPAAEGEDAVEITAGNVKIKGLPLGTYYLQETKAPIGYKALENPVIVTIAKTETDYAVTATHAIVSDKVVSVTNYPIDPLPETGGVGTTMFYVVGAVLVVAAVALVATKKRYAAK